MFKKSFSFSGRIGRIEYFFSFLIYIVSLVMIGSLAGISGLEVFGILYVPIYWFLYSQGAKRCHDLGHNGWWQIIPFYFFWLLFEKGSDDENKYGKNINNPNSKETNKEKDTGRFCGECGQKSSQDSKYCSQCANAL